MLESLAVWLDDRTPLVQWWHYWFGHGEVEAEFGICWACGAFEEL